MRCRSSTGASCPLPVGVPERGVPKCGTLHLSPLTVAFSCRVFVSRFRIAFFASSQQVQVHGDEHERAQDGAQGAPARDRADAGDGRVFEEPERTCFCVCLCGPWPPCVPLLADDTPRRALTDARRTTRPS